MRLSGAEQEIGTSFPAWTGWPVVAGAWLWTLSVILFVTQAVAQAASAAMVVVLGVKILLAAAGGRPDRAGSRMDSGA